jgi:hypothetical protein
VAEESEEATPINNRFENLYGKELEANRTEQQDVTARLALLQKRLQQLKEDEAWLVQAQGALPPLAASTGESEDKTDTGPAAEEDQPRPKRKAASRTKAGAEPTSEAPGPRRGKQANSAQPEPAETTTVASGGSKTTKAAPKTTASAGRTQPPLGELVLAILLKTPGNPRLVREIHEDLVAQHPERATSSLQVVRNTAEALVRKNLVEKTRQQGSAMYTAHPSTPDAPARKARSAGKKQAASV